MAARRVSIALIAAFLWQFSAPVSAQSTSEILTDPTPFEIGYGMSFYDFDACGDSEAGQVLRRAIIEKLERCPFSQEAMEEFQDWRIETLEHFVTELWQAQYKGIKPKGPLELQDGDVKSCAAYHATPQYQARRAALMKYDRGEIGVDEVIGSECPSGPASL